VTAASCKLSRKPVAAVRPAPVRGAGPAPV
jgi:hypothetical protein